MKPGYFAIVPASVRYDTELRPNEKLMYAELTCHAGSAGFCTLSNACLADLYGVSRQSVSMWIKHLEQRGYVSIEYIRDGDAISERRIYIKKSEE